MDIPGLQHHYTTINGIRMHYVTAGEGPPLVLLHGFPEFWYGWRHQIPVLSQHFTVIAPDLRGYNETDKPTWGYEVDVLVTDVLELINALGYGRAVVVGHDWGGMLAWTLAMTHPQQVERLIVMNLPHPALLLKALSRNPRQMLRSFYIGFFQIPWLPEALLQANLDAFVEQAFRGLAVRKEAFSDADIAHYRAVLSQPGALTAALNWYRGMAQSTRRPPFSNAAMTVDVPTLLIWGHEDIALGTELTYGTEQYVPDLQIRYIANCSHWVQHERPDLVNQSILDFLASVRLQP